MLPNILRIYVVIFQLLVILQTGAFQKEVYQHPNSGEYVLDWKYIGPCENGRGSNEIQMNVKLTKKNKRPQMFGNYTFLIPWDESIHMHLHYMKMGFRSDSAWSPKVYLWTLTGCTQYRLILAGFGFLSHMGMPNRCPIPKGAYVMKEYDVDKIIGDVGPLIPKTFLYGSYKIFCELKKTDRTVGCARIAIDVIPKWQRRNKTRFEQE